MEKGSLNMFNLFSQSRANRRPPSNPPNFTPTKGQGKKMSLSEGPLSSGGPSTKAVESGAIFPCMNRFVYIWPNNGPGFWAYVTFVGRRSIAGWRFRRGRFQYFGMDLRQIDEFFCN